MLFLHAAFQWGGCYMARPHSGVCSRGILPPAYWSLGFPGAAGEAAQICLSAVGSCTLCSPAKQYLLVLEHLPPAGSSLDFWHLHGQKFKKGYAVIIHNFIANTIKPVFYFLFTKVVFCPTIALSSWQKDTLRAAEYSVKTPLPSSLGKWSQHSFGRTSCWNSAYTSDQLVTNGFWARSTFLTPPPPISYEGKGWGFRTPRTVIYCHGMSP